MIKLPTVELRDVKNGSFLIVRYMPYYQRRGIVATKVKEVYSDGFLYANLSMGVEGNLDKETLKEIEEMGGVCDELLVGLPEGFEPPLPLHVVYSTGGVYIPKEKELILPRLSRDENYQKSLQGLKNHNRIMTTKELRRILKEGQRPL